MEKEKLLRKIEDKSIQIGVVGLGYVGLPLAVEKAKAGYRTTGFDVNRERVQMVNRGKNYIGDVVDQELQNLVQSGMLSATEHFEEIVSLDFIVICVPTPLDEHQQPNISYVQQSVQEIAKYLKRGTVIVLESTTYPGTTEQLVKPILEQGSGLKCGEDFYLGFSPERVDPGNLIYKTKNTPKVVGAIGKDAAEVITKMYSCVLQGEVTTVSSPAVAEMEKILENCYRNINIGFINEMAMLCEKMGINIWEVIDAAKTKPYGFQAFYPGAGPGGHCIPLDPYYLSWKAREYGFHTSIIEASGMINDRMPDYCAGRVGMLLNLAKKTMNGAKILVLGVAYKQNISDYRESSSIKLIASLCKSGAEVDFYDPYVSEYRHKGNRFRGLDKLDAAGLSQYDIAVVATPHTNVDYQMLADHVPMIFDIKNALKEIKNREHIYLL